MYDACGCRCFVSRQISFSPNLFMVTPNVRLPTRIIAKRQNSLESRRSKPAENQKKKKYRAANRMQWLTWYSAYMWHICLYAPFEWPTDRINNETKRLKRLRYKIWASFNHWNQCKTFHLGASTINQWENIHDKHIGCDTFVWKCSEMGKTTEKEQRTQPH